jgi:hypothetical protein
MFNLFYTNIYKIPAQKQVFLIGKIKISYRYNMIKLPILGWNFINIRVEKIEHNKARGNRIDVMGVRTYFEDLYNTTKYPFCLRMLEKIRTIEVSNIETNSELEGFIIKNQSYFEQIALFDQADFQRLNEGVSISNVLVEKEIVRKFGG